MPVTIMSWNIEDLTLGKLQNTAIDALIAAFGNLTTEPAAAPWDWVAAASTPAVLAEVDQFARDAIGAAVTGARNGERTEQIKAKVLAAAPKSTNPVNKSEVLKNIFRNTFIDYIDGWNPGPTPKICVVGTFRALAATFSSPLTSTLSPIIESILPWNPATAPGTADAIRQQTQQAKTAFGTFVTDMIVDTVCSSVCDILVIYELRSGTAVSQFTLIDGSGRTAAMRILLALRARLTQQGSPRKYYLIPPVRLGSADQDLECIAIIYNGTKLRFQGPWMVTTTGFGPVAAQDQGNYPNEWKRALPDDSLTVNGVEINENQLSAQTHNYKKALSPREVVDFGRGRPPVFAQFREKADEKRLISLMAVHLMTKGAAYSVQHLATAHCLVTKPAGDEVRVVVGDFNLNAVDYSDWTDFSEFSDNTKAQGFSWNVLYLPVAGVPAGRQSIVTVLKPLGTASLGSGDYPSYSYVKGEALDNVLIMASAGQLDTQYKAAQKAKETAIVVNRVVGVSSQKDYAGHKDALGYGYVPPPPPQDFKFTYPTAMAESCTVIMTNATQALDTTFREFRNFGKIRWTSDHMPIRFTV